MSDTTFHNPQRQSVTGVLLIFATSLYRIIRNFWAIGVYLLVMDPEPRMVFLSVGGLILLLIGSLVYSVLYYLRFLFHVDEKENSFVLQKGVFNTDVVNIPFNKIQQVNFRRSILQRAIGVYSVVIDTAGSSDKEIEIKALSKKKADILAELLMNLSAKERKEEVDIRREEDQAEVSETAAESHVEWEYKLDFLSLLKLGLTSNYLRGLSILLAFYFTIRSQFSYSEEIPLEVPYAAVTEIFSTMAIILILLVVGMLITVAETFIKYYDLHLVKSSSGLQVEMGLRENTRVNLRARRVQLLRKTTNPLHKWMDLYKLKVSLASSRDDLDKDHIKIPGLSQEVVTKVKAYFYKSEILEKQQIFPHKILLMRRISRSTLPVVIGVVLIILFVENVPLWLIIAGGIIVIVLTALYQYFYFRTIRLSVSDEFLVKHSGIWSREEWYIEMYKLQSVSVSQPVWYKRRGLVNLTFHSAGGDISFPLVRKAEILPLMNYLMYRIEVTSKPWM